MEVVLTHKPLYRQLLAVLLVPQPLAYLRLQLVIKDIAPACGTKMHLVTNSPDKIAACGKSFYIDRIEKLTQQLALDRRLHRFRLQSPLQRVYFPEPPRTLLQVRLQQLHGAAVLVA